MKNSSKKIFLAGGGTEDQERPVLTAFLNENVTPRVLYIPLALHPDSDIFKNSLDWINQTIKKTSPEKGAHILKASAATDIQTDFNCIFIGGGNTYRLAHELKKTGLDKIIKDSCQKGIPIYGGSAGAIICGKSLFLAKSERINFIDTDGLNFLDGLSCCCHYEESDKKKIQDHILHKREHVIALSESSGIIIKSNQITSCNVEPTRIFLGDQEILLAQGETVTLSEIL